MQQPNRIRILAVIASLCILSSCSKTNKPGRMVPKDAGFIMHLSGKSMTGKMNMAEIRQTEWYKQLLVDLKSDSTQNELMKKIGENAKNAGLDSLADYIIFADNSRIDSSYMVMQGGLKDAAALAAFIKIVYPAGIISKDGDIQSMPIEDKAVLTWNKEKVMVGYILPSSNNYSRNNWNDSAVRGNFIPQITSYCKSLFALKEDNSMATDDKFTDLVNTDGDMHCWINLGKLMNNMPQMGALSMLKLDNFIEGNITAYTLNFENGKITLKSKGYFGKEVDKIMKKYGGGSINSDMLKNIPTNNIAGVMALHFNPDGLKELVKLSGMDGMVDLILVPNGISIDDFIKANKGDIMISVSDLSLKKDSFSFPSLHGKSEIMVTDKPDAKFIFSAAINDKDAFNKIINYAKKQVGDMGTDAKISFHTNAGYFAIGNSTDYITRYLAGGKTDLPWMNKISGKPIGMYIDLQKIIKVFSDSNAKDSISKKISEISLSLWDNIIYNGGNYNDGAIEQVLEVNMMDKNTNSMKQLFKYMAVVAALEKQKTRSLTVDIEKIN